MFSYLIEFFIVSGIKLNFFDFGFFMLAGSLFDSWFEGSLLTYELLAGHFGWFSIGWRGGLIPLLFRGGIGTSVSLATVDIVV